MADKAQKRDDVLDEIAEIRERIGEIRKDFTDRELLDWYSQQAQKARSRVTVSAD